MYLCLCTLYHGFALENTCIGASLRVAWHIMMSKSGDVLTKLDYSSAGRGAVGLFDAKSHFSPLPFLDSFVRNINTTRCAFNLPSISLRGCMVLKKLANLNYCLTANRVSGQLESDSNI